MGSPPKRFIRVGITEKHGMASEFSQYPPTGVVYSFLKPSGPPPRYIRSPLKGYLNRFDSDDHDIVESILSPVLTRNRWIYSAENLQAALAFDLFGLPTPRAIRMRYIAGLLKRDNCRGFVLWSEAGRATLESYGRIQDREILDKVSVVYPAIGTVDAARIRYSDGPAQLLFSGDFFRKGGANVIDAFELLQQEFKGIRLTLCCDENLHFRTHNTGLRTEYLARIRNNPAINMIGLVPRDKIINELLPSTDVYLLPTYVETFGFAILEAMAFGIPVVTTNYFAIPEMVGHGVTGFMIDTSRFDCEQMFKGYVVNGIPPDFKDAVTRELVGYLRALLESPQLRRQMGERGVQVARTKFSADRRKEQMGAIYQRAVS